MKSYALFITAVLASANHGCASRDTARPVRARSPGATVDSSGAQSPAPNAANARVTLATLVALERSIRPQDPARPELLMRIATEALDLASAERAGLDGADTLAPWPRRSGDNEAEATESAEQEAPAPARDAAALARLTAAQRQGLARYDSAMQFAIRVLDRRVNTYPTAPRADEALFLLASSLNSWGREANATYHALIRRFPTSRWVGHAWVFFGDYFFEREEMEPAAQAYQRAIDAEGSTLAPYATFKFAWARMNQSRFDEAAQAFASAVTRARNANTPVIVREAARDLALAITQSPTRTPATIVEFLVATAHDDEALAHAMLDRAMNQLRDIGRGPDAVALWVAAAARDGEWACARGAHANEAAGGDAALTARVAALQSQLQCP